MQQLSLTRFELYKLFTRKSVWIVLGVLLFVVYIPLELPSLSERNHPGYYQQTQPTLRQVQQAKAHLEQVQLQMSRLNQGSNAYSELQSQAARDEAIVDSAQGTKVRKSLDELQKAIAELKAHGNTGFSYRMYLLEYDMMSKLPFIGAGYHYAGPEMAIAFIQRFGFVIFAAIVMFGLSAVFADEYANGTDSFLLTTKRGKRQVVTAKLAASILYVCAMDCILFGVNLAWNLSVFGAKGLNYPLQSSPLFSAPFHLTIWQYIVVATLVQMLGGISFGSLVVFVSSLTRISLIPFFVATGVLALPELIVKFFPSVQWSQTVMRFSYTGLLEVSGTFNQFVVYNLNGYPVLYPQIVIALAVLMSIPFVSLTYIAFSKHQGA